MYIEARTGEEFEEELLRGSIRESRKNPKTEGLELKRKHKSGRRPLKRGYVGFTKSLMIAKSHQPWKHDPKRPHAPFLREMYDCIAPSLRKGRHYLRVFIAIKTPLDYWHGVDFFFEYEGKVVTVDITLKPRKDFYKADILITLNDIQSNAHHRKAQEIARLLQQA